MSIRSPLPRNLRRGLIQRTVIPVVEEQAAAPQRTKRILFASAHSIVDFSNGASVATLDMLEGHATAGFDCPAFCAAKLDYQREASLDEIVDAMHEPHHDETSVSQRCARVSCPRTGPDRQVSAPQRGLPRRRVRRPENTGAGS